MALVICKECGKTISELAKACPSCGCPLEEQTLLRSKVPGKKCISCQAIIPIQADHCPACSAKQKGSKTNATSQKPSSKRFKTWMGVAIVIIALTAWGGILKNRPVSEPANTGTSGTRTSSNASDEVNLTEEGNKVKAQYPQWSNDICNRIGEKKIQLGMTKEQVIAAWGKPYKVNQSIGSWGEREQWVVDNSTRSDYLYFHNGILKSMQRSQ